ncbi:MAG: M48 family metalloprotease [Thermoguttaceae bacterium]|nr:M48 family metalloprotease [Thermoguttaceae bacterium]
MRYQHYQRRARHQTIQLVLLFSIAITIVVASVASALTGLYFLFARMVPEHPITTAASEYNGGFRTEESLDLERLAQQVANSAHPPTEWLFLGIAVAVLGLILLMVLARALELREQGGVKLAESLGGVCILPGTLDLKQRRLLNIVEEIAIAAETATPQVYLLGRQRGINVMVAGRSPTEAVIVVTQGTLDYLNRDELQGVIAHEFSHILEEDMRINMRTLCWIYGVSAVSDFGADILTLGWRLLDAGSDMGFARSWLRWLLISALELFYFIAGGLLWFLGLAGTLCGNLVQAAIGRQRELLADASAVALTRNPAGLASALRKIAVFAYHGELVDISHSEMNFLFFTSGIRTWFRVHPPVRERIRRLEGEAGLELLARMEANPKRYLQPVSVTGSELLSPVVIPTAPRPLSPEAMAKQVAEHAVSGFASIFALADEIVVEEIVDENHKNESETGVDSPHVFHQVLGAKWADASGDHTDWLTEIESIYRGFPPELQEASQDPWSARAVLLALLFPKEAENYVILHQTLRQSDPVLGQLYENYRPSIDLLSLDAKMVLIDVVLRTLRMMRLTQRQVFLTLIDASLARPTHLTMVEQFYMVVIRTLLTPAETTADASRPSKDSPNTSGTSPYPTLAVWRLLGIIAYQGTESGHPMESDQDSGGDTKRTSAAALAYTQGAVALGVRIPTQIPDRGECTFPQLLTSFAALRGLTQEQKGAILRAVLAVIAADGVVTLCEAFFIRMLGAALDHIVPLLLPNEQVP